MKLSVAMALAGGALATFAIRPAHATLLAYEGFD